MYQQATAAALPHIFFLELLHHECSGIAARHFRAAALPQKCSGIAAEVRCERLCRISVAPLPRGIAAYVTQKCRLQRRIITVLAALPHVSV